MSAHVLSARRLAAQIGRPCVVLTDGANYVTTEQIDAFGRWWSDRYNESGEPLFGGYWVVAHSSEQVAA